MIPFDPSEDKYARFARLHVPGTPLLMPNPWDAGSARLLASLGFQALATTSGGFAASLCRPDGAVSRQEALEHARAVAAAVDLPVSADLENCFDDAPEGVAETVRLAAATGVAGCSVEDWSGSALYPAELAAERVAAAAEAAHGGGTRLVLTARAENHIRANPDLGDTISRLQAYQAAGADVLYAPGLVSLDDVKSVVSNVDRPLNVLALDCSPPVPELASAGVARISVGSSFAWVAAAAVVEAAAELLERGTYGWRARAGRGADAVRRAVDRSER